MNTPLPILETRRLGKITGPEVCGRLVDATVCTQAQMDELLEDIQVISRQIAAQMRPLDRWVMPLRDARATRSDWDLIEYRYHLPEDVRLQNWTMDIADDVFKVHQSAKETLSVLVFPHP